MLNINVGRNQELMEKCSRLEEYAIFVAAVRKYAVNKKLELGEAISEAMDECIEKGVLLDILIKQRAEVFAVVLETFDKELYERDLEKNITERVKKEVTERVEKEVTERVEKEVAERVEKEVTERVEKEVTERVKKEVREKIEAEVKRELREAVSNGENRKLIEQISRKLHKGKTVLQIADELEENIENVQKLVTKIQQNEG